MPDRPMPPMNSYPMPASDAVPVGQTVPTGKELFNFVFDRMQDGESRAQICGQLAAFGYGPDDASMIVADIAERRRYFLEAQAEEKPREELRANARRTMLIGASVCALGGVITVSTALLAASGFGGGVRVIAYGAIIWGAVMICRGYSQSRQT